MKLLKNILFLSGIVLLCSAVPKENSAFISADNILRVQDTIKEWQEVQFDSLDIINRMAYADTANFMHEKIYPCARCFLRPEVAGALEKANQLAKDKGYKLIIYDCYRPYGYQRKMYEIVNNPLYVAKPGKGSNHNRGAAIDLSLTDADGNLLDMGGAFDDFSKISHYSADGISKVAKKNRKLLRTIMTKAGFTPYENEWWHFDYRKKRYPTAGFVWDCK
jgi:D-alanyl-D-alanine dipeptidase